MKSLKIAIIASWIFLILICIGFFLAFCNPTDRGQIHTNQLYITFIYIISLIGINISREKGTESIFYIIGKELGLIK